MTHILVVDDSVIVRSILRSMLESMHFSVTEAEHGEQALAVCAQHLPDAIILDWRMPVMDGMEFLRAFRADPAHAEVRVIFCSVENSIEKIAEALESGADEYIMKPFDITILREKLQQLGIMEAS